MNINHRVDGERGPWVTLVTGIANDTTMWNAQMPALTPQFRVLRYDLRGQGGSEATKGDYSIALLLQDLIDLLDSLKIEKTHLVGLGLGGCIVQAAAIEHPVRVAKLMPCCCRAQMVPDFAVMWRGLIENVKKNGFESIVEPTVQRWFSDEFKAAHPDVMENVRKMIRRTSLDGYLGNIAAFLGVSLEERLPLIRAHALRERRGRQAGWPA